MLQPIRALVGAAAYVSASVRGLPNTLNPVGGLDGFCSIIETTAAVVVALTGGMLVAVLALLSPVGLPVHSPGVFGVDRNASRCSRLASSRSSRCRPRTSAGVASGAGEQLAEERLHEDGEGARAASAGDRAPARAAAASEIGRPVEGYGAMTLAMILAELVGIARLGNAAL